MLLARESLRRLGDFAAAGRCRSAWPRTLCASAMIRAVRQLTDAPAVPMSAHSPAIYLSFIIYIHGQASMIPAERCRIAGRPPLAIFAFARRRAMPRPPRSVTPARLQEGLLNFSLDSLTLLEIQGVGCSRTAWRARGTPSRRDGSPRLGRPCLFLLLHFRLLPPMPRREKTTRSSMARDVSQEGFAAPSYRQRRAASAPAMTSRDHGLADFSIFMAHYDDCREAQSVSARRRPAIYVEHGITPAGPTRLRMKP